MTKMTMTIEPVSAFSSLDVLVAMDEGHFRRRDSISGWRRASRATFAPPRKGPCRVR